MVDRMSIMSGVISRNEVKFVANKLGDDMVMMDMDTGDFITMNSVGADIWDICSKPVRMNALIGELLGRYNISEAQCLTETVSFLQKSIGQGMFLLEST